MNQTSVIAGALIVAYIVFVTVRGELPGFLYVLTGQGTAPSAGGTSTTSGGSGVTVSNAGVSGSVNIGGVQVSGNQGGIGVKVPIGGGGSIGGAIPI